MDSFKYDSFEDENMIRLLQPTSESCHEFHIRHFRLDAIPPYAALSYTWGENIFDHPILIEGKRFSVTKNLHRGLAAIHKSMYESGLLLWIDAVCINQADIPERGSQVSLMDKIYKTAQKVVVWLGESSGDSDLAMEKMIEWRDMLDTAPGKDHTSRYYHELGTVTEENKYYGPPGSHEHRAWLAILALWERPWWRRAWIVQEATALPLTQTELNCGGKMADMRALRLVLDIRYRLAQLEGHYLMATFEQGFAEILDNFKSKLEYGPQSFLDVLQQIRTYDCKDSRDKVYAARGMASDITPDALVPDYTKSIEDVYIEVVQFLQRTAGPAQRLDFLGYVITPTDEWDRLSTPSKLASSWVPDWRGPKMDVIGFKKTIASHASQPSLPAYTATLDSAAKLKIHGHKLNIHGLDLDSVVTVTDICTEGRPLDTTMEHSWLPEDADQAYVSGGTLRNAYNHTLVADMLRKHDPGDWQSPWQRGGVVDWALVHADASSLSEDDTQRKLHLLNALKCTTFGRRMFLTSKGYIGIGPAAMQVGDRICALLGGSVLYVVRRESLGYYGFVGECYTHGLMDGRAMEMEATGELKIEEFVII